MDTAHNALVKKTGENHPAQEGPVVEMRNAHKGDPIASSADGQWWFWDESWSSLHGPFGSEAEADQVLAAYADQLLCSPD